METVTLVLVIVAIVAIAWNINNTIKMKAEVRENVTSINNRIEQINATIKDHRTQIEHIESEIESIKEVQNSNNSQMEEFSKNIILIEDALQNMDKSMRNNADELIEFVNTRRKK